jgi:hypothetical protein
MGLRPTQGDEERWWRELQLAASASAGGLHTQSSDGECAANFGLFFNGADRHTKLLPTLILTADRTTRSDPPAPL